LTKSARQLGSGLRHLRNLYARHRDTSTAEAGMVSDDGVAVKSVPRMTGLEPTTATVAVRHPLDACNP